MKGTNIEQMKNEAGEKENKWTHRNKYGVRRDRSVSLGLVDGDVKFHAASEFAGTGNGDYYVMFSPTRAFYCESD